MITLDLFLTCGAFAFLTMAMGNVVDIYWTLRTRRKAERDFEKARSIMDEMIIGSREKKDKVYRSICEDVN